MDKIITLIALALLWNSCTERAHTFDASGSFEALERIVSAQANGKILNLTLEEGDVLKTGQTVGLIDTTLLALQAAQARATISAISAKTGDPGPQIDVLRVQLKAQKSQVEALEIQQSTVEKNVERLTNMVAAQAAPQKQLDDLIGQRDILTKQLQSAREQSVVIEQQIKSARSTSKIQNRGILSELEPAKKRYDLIRQQIKDAYIINDFPGTVLTKYVEEGELATMGKPLYKIADLENIYLRAYITGNQLAQVQLHDTVKVFTDDGQGHMAQGTGEIIWISSEAEFTPKTIQTKEERAHLVYAIKVKTHNTGTYKIGMYGEIQLPPHE